MLYWVSIRPIPPPLPAGENQHMAGSLTYRSYTADSGVAYAVRVDESNSNATVSGGTGVLMPIRTTDLPSLPKGIKLRYALGRAASNPLIRRRFYIGTLVNYAAAAANGATISAEDYPAAGSAAGTTTVFTITAVRGEKSNKIPAFGSPDTGLTDGTAAQ
jgi:hypothetical protein